MKKTLSALLCCALISIGIPIHSYGAQLEDTPQEDCPTLIERVKQQGKKQRIYYPMALSMRVTN